jgi:hypothetical protein
MRRVLPIGIAIWVAACIDDPLVDDGLAIGVSVDELSPSIVPSTGGVELSFFGKNFPADVDVLIGGVRPPGLAWRSSTRLTAVAPRLAIGKHEVVIVAAGRQIPYAPGLRVYATTVAFEEQDPAWARLPEGQTYSARGEIHVADLDSDGLDDAALSVCPTLEPNVYHPCAEVGQR